MVESLRVAELRSLLSTMGKDKKGLKKDLLQRATELLQNNFHPELFSAIQELYHRRHSTGNTNSRRSQVITMPATVGVEADYPKKSCSPVHKLEVHMIKLPFCQTLETIVAPKPLVATYASTQQIDLITFSLTTKQWSRIKNCPSKDGVKPVQVVLRICYTESIGVENDQYPPNVGVLVNGYNCPVQVHSSSNKKSLEPSQPCRPIDLTPFMKAFTDNRVAITWENFGKFYSVAVYLVKVYSSADLLAQLQKNGVESVESCKQKVCEKLQCNPENEIATTGLQVSLICPQTSSKEKYKCCTLKQCTNCCTKWLRNLSAIQDPQLAKMRMSDPCRAQTCAHMQCFDAAFYLQMNERKPSWTCPVCHKPALFDTLQIDGLLSGILQRADEAVKEIEYLSNGSWRAVGKEKVCSTTTDLSSLSHSKTCLHLKENNPLLQDIVDLTQFYSDSDDDHEAMETEEIVWAHVKIERVRFSKSSMHK